MWGSIRKELIKDGVVRQEMVSKGSFRNLKNERI